MDNMGRVFPDEDLRESQNTDLIRLLFVKLLMRRLCEGLPRAKMRVAVRSLSAMYRMITDSQTFENYRPLLFSIAYRMLGSAMEAEDMVQEAYLRYQNSADKPDRIDQPI